MKLNALDLNKLRVFCEVVEQDGYRGASERLGLTRSAISQAVTALEAQIGIPLFRRSGRKGRSGAKLVLTEEAERFYEEAMRAMGSLESALARLQNREEALGGRLRIGAYGEFAKSKLMPLIERFLVANPGAEIQFRFDSPSRLETLLESGRIDLAVSIFPHRSRGIASRKLYEEELCLVSRKDLVARDAALADLARVPVIDYFPSHVLFKRWWNTHFKKAPARVWIRAYAASADMVLEMVERRLGVGVVPRYLLSGASDRVHVVEPTPHRLVDHLWLNRARGEKRGKLEEALVGILEKELRAGS